MQSNTKTFSTGISKLQSKAIYLDNASTTPLDSQVLEAMMPYLTSDFGNPASSTHSYGRTAETAVEKARTQLATILNCEAKEILWTSGASEANNLAIKGIATDVRARGKHIIIQATEHAAVTETCRWLAGQGFEITVLPVSSTGQISASDIGDAIRSDTMLASIMFANNEIGTILPIKAIGETCKERGVLFHVDCAQALGKVDINLSELDVDLMSVSSHKIHGPKGVGALFVRNSTPRIRLSPIIHGGGHERGIRAGTLNVPGIVGFGEACNVAQLSGKRSFLEMQCLRDLFEQRLKSLLPGVSVNGDLDSRLPTISNVTISGVEAEALVLAVPELAISTGSACTSTSIQPSHVLKAIGLSDVAAHQTLRLSFSRHNTALEIETATIVLTAAATRLRELNNVFN